MNKMTMVLAGLTVAFGIGAVYVGAGGHIPQNVMLAVLVAVTVFFGISTVSGASSNE